MSRTKRMTEFVNPFSGMEPDRGLNNREPAGVMRLALAVGMMEVPIS